MISSFDFQFQDLQLLCQSNEEIVTPCTSTHYGKHRKDRTEINYENDNSDFVYIIINIMMTFSIITA